MSSNHYNPYSFNISHLNSLISDVGSPEMGQEDLTELALWRNVEFTFDVPPGMGLLDDDFDVSPKAAKLKDEVPVGVPNTTLPYEYVSQQVMSPFLAFTTGTPVTHLQPMVSMAPSSTSNEATVVGNSTVYSLMYPQLPTAVTVPSSIVSSSGRNTGNPVILPKPPANASSKINKNKTEQKIAPAPSSTPPSRKNSLGVSSKASNSFHDKKIALDIAASKLSPPSRYAASSSSKTDDDEDDSKTSTDPETAARLAAEEDKRKRNTAASARFRIKKKKREQALEHTAKEMTTKAEILEGKVKELELEIKWLRSLIVEKDARLLDVDRPEKKRRTVSSD